MAVDTNGLFARARKAAEDWNKSVGDESTAIENAMLIMNEIAGGSTSGGETEQPPVEEKVEVQSITLEPQTLELKEKGTGSITATVNPPNATNKTITWSTENDQIATVTDNKNGTAIVTGVKAGTTNIVATADGVEARCSVEVKPNGVIITKDNYRNYLGKVVTNFRPAGTGETEDVTDILGETYTVGTKYRLYYVDFGDEEHPNGKYGDGAGTIYLKADCTNKNYALPRTDTTAVDNTKMKQLNPALYKTTPPGEGYNNMRAVKWLLNPANWESLKTNSPIKDSVNYVVGSPSLEMMMDSYNTYYNLQDTATSPQTGSITAGDRRKLFYQYTVGDYGYNVGPGYKGREYFSSTEYNSVYTDEDVDEMYYPGSGHMYWLASPSSSGSNALCVMRVSDSQRGLGELLPI